MDAKKIDFVSIFILFYWFFIDFNWFSLIFHWFSLIFHPKTTINHPKSFKIGAKSCIMMKKTHNFHQNRHLIHYVCEKSRFHLDFYWFLLIFIDFHWFSLIFIDFHWFSLIFHPKPIQKPLKSLKNLQNLSKIMQNEIKFA